MFIPFFLVKKSTYEASFGESLIKPGRLVVEVDNYH